MRETRENTTTAWWGLRRSPASGSTHPARPGPPSPRSFGEEGGLLTYGGYLRLPDLLAPQVPQADPGAHDELLFWDACLGLPRARGLAADDDGQILASLRAQVPVRYYPCCGS